MKQELRDLINDLRSAAYNSGWINALEMAGWDASQAMNEAEKALIDYLEKM